MKRLTEVDKSGNWHVAGVEWGKVKGNLYGALCKLKDYEDTGLAPQEIEILLETGKLQIMDCTGCIHKSNKQFCLNCFRGGSRDYYLAEGEM